LRALSLSLSLSLSLCTISPDTTAPHTIYNAWDGGMAHVDVYLFPCYKCGNAAGQIKSTIDYLNSYNAKWGTTWLDIEGMCG
jgi:hypothetical protein